MLTSETAARRRLSKQLTRAPLMLVAAEQTLDTQLCVGLEGVIKEHLAGCSCAMETGANAKTQRLAETR